MANEQANVLVESVRYTLYEKALEQRDIHREETRKSLEKGITPKYSKAKIKRHGQPRSNEGQWFELRLYDSLIKPVIQETARETTEVSREKTKKNRKKKS